ncbi:MAG: transcription antitermination factor NusB [Parachlamydiales bacterium]|nr:transcription antitermination factor NusB [Parachlamydiales bacterium]
MVSKQKFHEIVFWILYSMNFSEQDKKESIFMMMHLLKVTKSSIERAWEYAEEVQKKQKKIDEQIRDLSTEYSFERISQVEKNILRLGIYEIVFDKAFSNAVVVAEAIRLCRKFGTRESAKFVHALLGAYIQKYHQS